MEKTKIMASISCKKEIMKTHSKKRIIWFFIIMSLPLFTACAKGEASFDDLKNLDTGISQEEVIENVGEPKDKTSDEEDILDWAPDYLINNKEEFPNLEMFVYNLKDRSTDEARLFFSDERLIYKRPVGLNKNE